MRLLHLGNIDFALSDSGSVSKSSKWQLIFEPTVAENETNSTDWRDFYSEALAWAGQIGEPFKLPAADSAGYTPDANYIIEKVTAKSLSRNIYELTIIGVPAAATLEGPFNQQIAFSADGEQLKTAQFRFTGEEPGALFPAIGDVVSWGGEDYFCRRVSAERRGAEWVITFQAQQCGIKLLEKRCEEEYYNYNPDGSVRSSRLYTGRWRVHQSKIAEFTTWVRGDARTEWAESLAHIVTQKYCLVSPYEFEYTLEAKAGYWPSNRKFSSLDDRSNLAGRHDFAVRAGEFRPSATQCGYYFDGENFALLSPWEPDVQCPFITANPLAAHLIETPLKTMLIIETIFWKNSAASHLNEIAAWWKSRVFSGKVGELSGSFLREEQQAEDVLDNEGEVYTRVTRHYRVAPDNLSWNPLFWEEQ
ncbi:MAG: hypothetical protein RRY34_03115 [Victivallaceae bacterium]